MSVNVSTYRTTPYRQTPVGWPTKIFSAPTQKPLGVLLNFNWSVYFALFGSLETNIAVEVDVNQGGTAQGPVIDKIVSVKIDNSNSYVPILVYFPDSGDLISCPPQTVATFPCMTNGSVCKVIAQGLATGFLPLTTISFYNFFVPPSLDPVLQIVYPQELGSPTIQRSGGVAAILSPGYGPRALGDQTVRLFFRGNSGAQSLLPAVAAGGFYTLTNFFVTGSNNGGAAETELTITQGADTLFDLRQIVNASVTILDIQGANIKVNATTAILATCIFNAAATILFNINLAYTYNLQR